MLIIWPMVEVGTYTLCRILCKYLQLTLGRCKTETKFMYAEKQFRTDNSFIKKIYLQKTKFMVEQPWITNLRSCKWLGKSSEDLSSDDPIV